MINRPAKRSAHRPAVHTRRPKEPATTCLRDVGDGACSEKSVLRAFAPDQPGSEEGIESMARGRGAKAAALIDEFAERRKQR